VHKRANFHFPSGFFLAAIIELAAKSDSQSSMMPALSNSLQHSSTSSKCSAGAVLLPPFKDWLIRLEIELHLGCSLISPISYRLFANRSRFFSTTAAACSLSAPESPYWNQLFLACTPFGGLARLALPCPSLLLCFLAPPSAAPPGTGDPLHSFLFF
jgi:hypothetical protein